MSTQQGHTTRHERTQQATRQRHIHRGKREKNGHPLGPYRRQREALLCAQPHEAATTAAAHQLRPVRLWGTCSGMGLPCGWPLPLNSRSTPPCPRGNARCRSGQPSDSTPKCKALSVRNRSAACGRSLHTPRANPGGRGVE